MLTWGVNANIWFLITYSLEVPNTPICRCGLPLNFMFLFRPVKKKKKLLTEHFLCGFLWQHFRQDLLHWYLQGRRQIQSEMLQTGPFCSDHQHNNQSSSKAWLKIKILALLIMIRFFNYNHCSASTASSPKSTGGGMTFLKVGHQHTTENAVLSQ